MAVNFREVVKHDGMYGPTGSGKYYMPNPVHNPNANAKNDKTRWCISEPHQYCVFEEADDVNRIAESGLLGLSVIDGKLEELGEDGEKVGFFPTPRNAADPWHGYPETMNRLGDDFDHYFVQMRDAGELNKSVCKKLLTKRI